MIMDGERQESPWEVRVRTWQSILRKVWAMPLHYQAIPFLLGYIGTMLPRDDLERALAFGDRRSPVDLFEGVHRELAVALQRAVVEWMSSKIEDMKGLEGFLLRDGTESLVGSVQGWLRFAAALQIEDAFDLEFRYELALKLDHEAAWTALGFRSADEANKFPT